MAITSRLVGKFGGGEVVIEPFSVQWNGHNDTQEDQAVYTVDGDDGQEYLVATIGEYQIDSNASHLQMEVYVGGYWTKIHPDMMGKTVSLSFVVSGGDTIMANKGGSRSAVVSFSGHVYAVPLP